MLKLRPLQDRLERIYDIDTCQDVDDFLITDRHLARALEGRKNARDTDELLLVREQDDGLDVSLFLDADLVGRLVADDPEHSLHDGNLADFCTVLEGVSHFVHLVWRARESRSTSRLELELQAEVDKFVSSINLLGRQGLGAVPPALHHRLFQQVRFDDALDDNERNRYETANRYAARYCHHLEVRFLHPFNAGPRAISDELRDFYRLNLREKIARIERAPAT